jgi:hypothetical protein
MLYALYSSGGAADSGVPREDVGLMETFAIEASEAALTPGNGEVSRGEDGAVIVCPIEGMNLS